jgi:hypothetical protein
MKRWPLVIIVVALYLLHQDFWFWRAAYPLVFGFLPIGLFYHVCYTLASSALMWLLVARAWPAHLEERVGDAGTRGDGDAGMGGRRDAERRGRGEAEMAGLEEDHRVAAPPRPIAAPEEGRRQ